MNTKIKSAVSLTLFPLLVLVMVSQQSCASGIAARNRSINNWEENEWKLVKADKDENHAWEIFTRRLAGTTFIEYRIEGNIGASPTACLAAFRQDIYRHTDESMRKKYPIYKITEESEKGLLTYVIHNEPFPLKDTEMRVSYSFSKKEDGSTEVKWNESWEDCPINASKKVKRIETFRGSWHFTPKTKNSCKGLKTVQFDPKKMPRWLFEPMVVTFLKDGLKEVKAIASPSQNLGK
jgi:hypothetical protein